MSHLFKCLVFTLLLLTPQAFAEGEHQEEDHAHEEGREHTKESEGFKLSPQAVKNFDLKTLKLVGHGPWTVPANAVVHSGEETNLFRLRDGNFKSIDFKLIKKSDSNLIVGSKDMQEGDEIVVSGLGFLKIAELAAFGGVAHGHSH